MFDRWENLVELLLGAFESEVFFQQSLTAFFGSRWCAWFRFSDKLLARNAVAWRLFVMYIDLSHDLVARTWAGQLTVRGVPWIIQQRQLPASSKNLTLRRKVWVQQWYYFAWIIFGRFCVSQGIRVRRERWNLRQTVTQHQLTYVWI